MWLPLLLLVPATLAAAFVAYGVDPRWAARPGGVDLVIAARTWTGPAAGLAVILCVGLIGIVVAGRRRAWWLIGLAPVLALFAHRFGPGRGSGFEVLSEPVFVDATEAGFLRPDDHVVGVVFSGKAYAFPFAALYRTPVVLVQDHDRRMMLLWSPMANRATAFQVGRDLRGRNLEVVGMPANALIVYDSRLGQFINGYTGRTPSGETPRGVGEAVPTAKTTWARWRARYPGTVALAPARMEPTAAGPIRPDMPMPPSTQQAQRRVVLVAATQPVAVPVESVGSTPLNLLSGATPIVLFREPATGLPKAFSRRLDDDLTPRFEPNRDPRRRGVFMVDRDTRSGWSAEGVAIDGRLGPSSRKLQPIPIDDDLFLGPLLFWLPQVNWVESP